MSISMHLENFIEIHQLTHMILNINLYENLTSIKGYNSVENQQKICSKDIEQKQNFDINQGP